ncbi:MAG TPA: alpha/beta fold hydrolase [Longimicrobiaceae bacterium]|nr:alpha/beta fold hydrolase [Longimicrobiaceae bacterium]
MSRKRMRGWLLGATLVLGTACAATAPFAGCAPECLPPTLTAAAEETAPSGPAGELVVLVHGLGRTRLSMLPLEWALEREGYRVLNWGYSSYSHTVPELGRRLADELEARGERPERVHFVGHSLGSIVVRWVLANRPPEAVGRVVMLAPPNQGSHAADRWAPWLGWLLRPLPELRTAAGSTARALPAAAGVPVGVIAGRYDGKVRVEETRLPGAAAHVVVPSAHTFIMARSDVRRLTVGFLREGRFPR